MQGRPNRSVPVENLEEPFPRDPVPLLLLDEVPLGPPIAEKKSLFPPRLSGQEPEKGAGFPSPQYFVAALAGTIEKPNSAIDRVNATFVFINQ